MAALQVKHRFVLHCTSAQARSRNLYYAQHNNHDSFLQLWMLMPHTNNTSSTNISLNSQLDPFTFRFFVTTWPSFRVSLSIFSENMKENKNAINVYSINNTQPNHWKIYLVFFGKECICIQSWHSDLYIAGPGLCEEVNYYAREERTSAKRKVK